MAICPTCGGNGQYDPGVAQAARDSNKLDDTSADDFSRQLDSLDPSYGDGRGKTHGDNVAGYGFARQQDRDKLRKMLPGMTDYGIDQVKANVRSGKSIGQRIADRGRK